jgi:hypothetical protein
MGDASFVNSPAGQAVAARLRAQNADPGDSK